MLIAVGSVTATLGTSTAVPWFDDKSNAEKTTVKIQFIIPFPRSGYFLFLLSKHHALSIYDSLEFFYSKFIGAVFRCRKVGIPGLTPKAGIMPRFHLIDLGADF
jgi:hypothetical protein